MARTAIDQYFTEYKKRRYSVKEFNYGTWLAGDLYNDLDEAIKSASESTMKVKIVDRHTKEIVWKNF